MARELVEIVGGLVRNYAPDETERPTDYRLRWRNDDYYCTVKRAAADKELRSPLTSTDRAAHSYEPGGNGPLGLTEVSRPETVKEDS